MFPVAQLLGLRHELGWVDDVGDVTTLHVPESRWLMSTTKDSWVEIPHPVVTEMMRADPGGRFYRLYRDEPFEVATERSRQELNAAAVRVKKREAERIVLPLPGRGA